MLVPDAIRQSVAFIGYADKDGNAQLAGTAFVCASELDDLGVSDQAALFLVTARHVIDKIATKGGTALVRLNVDGQKAEWFRVPTADFLSHPQHPAFEAVDIAVAPIGLPTTVVYRAIPTKMFVNDSVIEANKIGLGDEVFVSGLFWNHQGKDRNLPIVRVGNIAAMPEEKIETKFGNLDAYLVEARSIGGLSGSPVFVNLGLTRLIDGKVMLAQNTTTGIFYFLGVMHGHWDSNGLLAVDTPVDGDAIHQERVNMGIAVVTPAAKLLEVLGTESAQQHRKLAAERTLARRTEEKRTQGSDADTSAP